MSARNNLLSGEQLVEHSKRIEEFVVAPRGNKISQLADQAEGPDACQSTELLDNLKEMLSFERVVLANKLSKGIYEADKRRVKVLNFMGKWNFGYMEGNVMYLKPYEALQLVEMGRLEVTYDSVIISLEQAYALFLHVDNGISFEEYLVFSHLSRAGYCVFQYDPQAEAQKCELRNSKIAINKEDEMIWCVLMEKLNLPVTKDFIGREYPLYEKTKKSMEDLCEKISGKRDDSSNTERSTSREGHEEKRNSSTEGEPSSKRQKHTEDESQASNFLDILKMESEYSTYKHIFDTFSIIKRPEKLKSSERELNFNFDVYLPKMNFKRTEDLPNYRLLVVKSTDFFPSNSELETLRRQQKLELPIVLAFVSESMTIHFSICTF